MALEATHMRFAVDVQKYLQIHAIDSYISGSIYPDSRYITGIDRQLTHAKDYKNNIFFMQSDFRKGWYSHLLCDEVQGLLMDEMIPETVPGDGKEKWIRRTAIKVLEDCDDAARFEISKYLPYLQHVENPNGENLETLRIYNAIFPHMYQNPENISVQNAIEMWQAFGVGKELVQRVHQQVDAYASDEHILGEVGKLYGRIREIALNSENFTFATN